MDYESALKVIATVGKRGSVFGLETIRALLDRLGNPQDRLKVIHVAGTNGKGSICAFLEAIYRAEGLRVGRYVSPTLVTYLERFQIDGCNMTEEEFALLLTQVETVSEQMGQEGLPKPTAFEMETAVAFLYFLKEQVDLVILETGMGGRLDATNVVAHPLCTVFASIGRDHTQVLGDNLEAIAREKAGIMREGCPVITYPGRREVMEVLKEEADRLHAPFTVVETEQLSIYSEKLGVTCFSYRGARYVIRLSGEHQVQNAAVAIQTKLVLDGTIRTESLADAVWPGRFEVLLRDPLLIRDGAHNPDGAEALRNALGTYVSDRRLIFIVGVFRDKEYGTMMELLCPMAERIYTVTPPGERGLEAGTLAECIRSVNPGVTACSSVAQALELAKEDVRQMERGEGKQAAIVAWGSLSWMAQVKADERDNRLDQILRHPQYLLQMERIKALEQNRIFCCHGLEHTLDVARILYILILEQKLDYSKELVYAAALLHDIGRAKEYEHGLSHHEEGARIAGEILTDCGFSKGETALIVEAIRKHRGTRESLLSDFAGLLCRADKLSRNCFACDAREACNWPGERQNDGILF